MSHPHLSRCLKKTPANVFTPISHSHISFSRPPRLPSIFCPAADNAEQKVECYLFIYEHCSKVKYLPSPQICVHLVDASELIPWNCSYVYANKAVVDTPPDGSVPLPPERQAPLGTTSQWQGGLQPKIIKHAVTGFMLYSHKIFIQASTRKRPLPGVFSHTDTHTVTTALTVYTSHHCECRRSSLWSRVSVERHFVNNQ